MLTDAALKNLRPKSKAYKSTDRDGMYAYVSPGGAISFRYDYRFNGRRETVTLGRYGRGGLSLAQARERLFDIKRTIAEGASPAIEKQRAKRRLKESRSFEHVAQAWMDKAPMADSTRNMRRSIFNREVLPKWRSRLLSEITPDDLRAHCKTIVDRGAPATAIHVRDIVKQIYGWAILHGEKIDNPADGVGPASIATFRPRDRSLSPSEIRIMLDLLGEVATLPTIRLGLKFVLLSMVRKSELQDGIWPEVDFENAVWSIPAARMKRSRPHNVYLSTQMLDILVALKTCAGNSKYILPSRYDADAPMSRATFNRVTTAIADRAKERGLPLEPFTVHDLRRTASTLLHEMGFNSDWIEKGLAHEERSSRGVYNKAEFEMQRRHMAQQWSDAVEAWEEGRTFTPVLTVPEGEGPRFDPRF
ncbi:site-specific integrase [Brevundimonas sp. SORGH_AS_0993]|uniref:tyrosine-type recombinase/integrase n=1 Tax=Brevundimonas sp. SORGH_AS_0993 TaxID=3041794 RepID=UPI0027840484|nr:site-specific integrase [Brevundimonas sp. SORGH_AS_0993]MDQ1153027.1 integrase [Brevundimonas sp. SORGH_AS_0993]